MDIDSVFWTDIPQLDSTILFALFIVLMVVLVILGLYYLKKTWKETEGFIQGRLLGAIIILPIILIGLFYYTASTTVPYDQPESEIQGVEIVSSVAEIHTFLGWDYFYINVTVKNEGNKTLSYPEINATGYDSSGNIVSTQNAAILGDLAPGQITSLNITLDNPNQKVVRYKLVIYE